jgi:hypothetical protein
VGQRADRATAPDRPGAQRLTEPRERPNTSGPATPPTARTWRSDGTDASPAPRPLVTTPRRVDRIPRMTESPTVSPLTSRKPDERPASIGRRGPAAPPSLAERLAPSRDFRPGWTPSSFRRGYRLGYHDGYRDGFADGRFFRPGFSLGLSFGFTSYCPPARFYTFYPASYYCYDSWSEPCYDGWVYSYRSWYCPPVVYRPVVPVYYRPVVCYSPFPVWGCYAPPVCQTIYPSATGIFIHAEF